jgi:mono/diheme cytochrome c family protein
MRWFLLVYVLIGCLWVGLFGWKGQKSSNRPVEVFQDLDHQRKVKAQTPSDFFADGVSSRRPVSNTIAMGLRVPAALSPADGSDLPSSYYRSGRFGDFFGEGFPKQVAVDQRLLDRGKERFGIYCAVCHGLTGTGQGVVGAYWPGGLMPPTANLVDDRVRALPDGQLFWTITNGKGLMGPYNGNVSVDDRWAIVAYLRALQSSSNADPNDPAVKRLLEEAKAASPKPATGGKPS